jgi:hypothetical protein
MPNKKHYWTQILLVTTLVSCGLGFVSGFGAVLNAPCAKVQNDTDKVAYFILESAIWKCANPTSASSRPIRQRGAIELEPYYANRIAAPPYNLNNQAMPPSVGMAVQGRNLRMEHVNGTPCCGSHPVHCTMDVTGIAIMLPLFVLGTLICFRRKFFPST